MAWRTLTLKLSSLGGASPSSCFRRVVCRSFAARSKGGKFRSSPAAGDDYFDDDPHLDELYKQWKREIANDLMFSPKYRRITDDFDYYFWQGFRDSLRPKHMDYPCLTSVREEIVLRNSVSMHGSARSGYEVSRCFSERAEPQDFLDSHLGESSNTDEASGKPFLHGAPHVPQYSGKQGPDSIETTSTEREMMKN